MGRISMPQGKGSLMHNRRDYEKIGRPIPDNINPDLLKDNITLVDNDLRQAYREIFGEALKQYNSKQKRADRRIEDYYDHIQKSRNGEKLFYEDVVQWGSMEDFSDAETRQRAKNALVEYASTFEARNQNLRLVGAYIHMDEASPHLHIDYVPVAHGYSRGMMTRNSLDRAMKEMGFIPEKESRKNNATKLWKERERMAFGEMCRSMGLAVEAERPARGSLSVTEYKDARDQMMGEIEQECERKKAELETLKTTEAALKKSVSKIKDKAEKIARMDDIEIQIMTPTEIDAIHCGRDMLGRSVVIKKDDFENLKNTARFSGIAISRIEKPLKTEIKNLRAAIKENQTMASELQKVKQKNSELVEQIGTLKEANKNLKEKNLSYLSFIARVMSMVKDRIPALYNSLFSEMPKVIQDAFAKIQRKPKEKEHDI